MPRDDSIKKTIILGSGPLKIGESGEFDYSGSQAIKALKEEGIKTILVNPNIATIQTSSYLAEMVYSLPVTPSCVEEVIKKEKPDSILFTFGGQTALNCGIALFQSKILEKHNIRILGTHAEKIIESEDRKVFAEELRKIGMPYPKGMAASSIKGAVAAAGKIGWPVMARGSFSLGGKGSGISADRKSLIEKAKKIFSLGKGKKIIIEECLYGWKEIEYEIIRDFAGNCISVCNMENIDPVGIHTGESIVVAPSQTLGDYEYQLLRRAAIRLASHFEIIGECNVQFALNPSGEYKIIEMNARLSRSSALASKATGYPIAYIAAKLALGYNLDELKNKVTGETSAFFEPSLDYVAVKIPRWDIEKYAGAESCIGSEMKSIGEVMAIARDFSEALQKAVRMLEKSNDGLTGHNKKNRLEPLSLPGTKRLFAIANAFESGARTEEISRATGIDPWFIYKIEEIVETKKQLAKESLGNSLLEKAKKKGFSDKEIARIKGTDEESIRKLREKNKIRPHIKQIDTLAAEFKASANYLYLTYNASENDFFPKKSTQPIIILGSGPYRIGSSVEFDWCCVNALIEAKKERDCVMINNNPETVSTDFDEASRLYFEELSCERITDICEIEVPKGVIISMGGQTPNNLAMPLSRAKINILGTSPESINMCEDRMLFSKTCDELGILQPQWAEATKFEEAKKFAEKAGYPVIIRPSYILGGDNIKVCHDIKSIWLMFLQPAKKPAVIAKFISGAKETEIDGAAFRGSILAYAISEHIEPAGIHSGDANVVFPDFSISNSTKKQMLAAAEKICAKLNITGPFNMQFAIKDENAFILECNLRASRSFPFISKASGANFASIATKAMLGRPPQKTDVALPGYYAVKSPQFSFSRLKGSSPRLGVEMRSTGEAAGFGISFERALLSAMSSTGFNSLVKSVLLSTGPAREKERFIGCARALSENKVILYATGGTYTHLKKEGIDSIIAAWPLSKANKDAVSLIKEGKISLVINIPKSDEDEEIENDYLIRRAAVDYHVPLITDMDLAIAYIKAYFSEPFPFEIKSISEYHSKIALP